MGHWKYSQYLGLFHKLVTETKKLVALDLCCYWCVCECFLALWNIADLKESAQHESFKLNSIWGQNEDCGLGDSISENSEKLLQGGRGR